MEVVFSLSSITFIYITVFWCVILTSVSVFPVPLQDFSEPPVTFLSTLQMNGVDLRTWTSCPSFFWDSLHGRFLYWILSFCNFLYFYYYRNTKSHYRHISVQYEYCWNLIPNYISLHNRTSNRCAPLFLVIITPSWVIERTLAGIPRWEWYCDYPVIGTWRVNYLLFGWIKLWMERHGYLLLPGAHPFICLLV